jgi:hypothetical protein
LKLRPLIGAALAPALVLAGCVGGTDEVADSTLPAIAETPPDGPAYLLQEWGPRRLVYSVVAGGSAPRELERVDEAAWLRDGRLLTRRATYKNTDQGPRRDGTLLEILDPVTGQVLAQSPVEGQWGIAPGVLTLRAEFRNRLYVFTEDLDAPVVIDVADDAVATDQLTGTEAEFSLNHAAYTLDGVTWVQWGINSEDDTKTDHGVLRIEDREPVEVLRNEPIVSLRPSRDGSALLVLMQDNGADEDCGGCVVEQTVIELDPATGEVAAEYGMPEDYDRSWRVELIDKIGGQVVVRFAIGEAEEEGDPGVSRQTWTYDGDWERVPELSEVRSWHQGGGRLEWQQLDTLRDEGEYAAMRLTWLPDDGAPVEIYGESASCPVQDDQPRCPLVIAPGPVLD